MFRLIQTRFFSLALLLGAPLIGQSNQARVATSGVVNAGDYTPVLAPRMHMSVFGLQSGGDNEDCRDGAPAGGSRRGERGGGPGMAADARGWCSSRQARSMRRCLTRWRARRSPCGCAPPPASPTRCGAAQRLAQRNRAGPGGARGRLPGGGPPVRPGALLCGALPAEHPVTAALAAGPAHDSGRCREQRFASRGLDGGRGARLAERQFGFGGRERRYGFGRGSGGEDSGGR